VAHAQSPVLVLAFVLRCFMFFFFVCSQFGSVILKSY
jgi:hypothetical protein